MHAAVALLKEGQRVGTIDLDSNQKSLTHYIENRCIWAKHHGIELETPIHRHIPRAEGAKLDENEAEELAAFEAVVASFGQSVDFLVIDTLAHDSYLRLGLFVPAQAASAFWRVALFACSGDHVARDKSLQSCRMRPRLRPFVDRKFQHDQSGCRQVVVKLFADLNIPRID
jgi:hypothetical protein